MSSVESTNPVVSPKASTTGTSTSSSSSSKLSDKERTKKLETLINSVNDLSVSSSDLSKMFLSASSDLSQLSPLQQQALALAVEQRSQSVSLISNLWKTIHEGFMNIIQNMRP